MKKIFVILLLCLSTLLSFSCEGEDEVSYATVTVYNKSDFDVTKLLAYAERELSVPMGEELTFEIQWAPGAPFPFSVDYYANGEFFSVDNLEGALYTAKGEHYYSPFLIQDGAKAFVYIKNEGISWKL